MISWKILTRKSDENDEQYGKWEIPPPVHASNLKEVGRVKYSGEKILDTIPGPYENMLLSWNKE